MASKTAIANRANLKLGQPRVSNIDTDGSVNAQVMSDMWDQVRDALLQSYPWNFAIKRATLATTGTTPDWGWYNEYSLPTDFLQLLEIKDNPDYKIEHGKILCDEDTLSIRYIARIENTGLYPALFGELLAYQLAIEGCERITQDKTLKAQLIQEMAVYRETVLSSDAIEDQPVEQVEDDWITVRA